MRCRMSQVVLSAATERLRASSPRLAEPPLAAALVEGRWPKVLKLPRARDGWLPDVLARLQIRYREIPIVFADSRKFAEEWTYRRLHPHSRTSTTSTR